MQFTLRHLPTHIILNITKQEASLHFFYNTIPNHDYPILRKGVVRPLRNYLWYNNFRIIKEFKLGCL